MNKKQKKMLWRIIVSAVLMVALHFVPVTGLVRFALYMLPYFIVGYDILWKAVLGIWNRQVFDENFLMAVATVGAIVIGLTDSGDYTEAIAVMLFYHCLLYTSREQVLFGEKQLVRASAGGRGAPGPASRRRPVPHRKVPGEVP